MTNNQSAFIERQPEHLNFANTRLTESGRTALTALLDDLDTQTKALAKLSAPAAPPPMLDPLSKPATSPTPEPEELPDVTPAGVSMVPCNLGASISMWGF